ncbi:MAG: threonylcarbamoyl-AMP synthase [Nitrospirae bacterium]|nr:threonylcarbamoyl-AMP synthase [Nitrospirota bacterium]
MERVRIEPGTEARAIARAAEIVRAGGLIAFPTDTYYGLGADPMNEEAVARIFVAKQRAPEKPVLILIADPRDVGRFAVDPPESARRLIGAFWPGPLTLILKAVPAFPSLLHAGTGRIGIRCPGLPLARDLARAAGGAITATSANVSGRAPIDTAEEVAAQLGDRIDLLLDAGRTPGGKESTVVSVGPGGVRVEREGRIAEEQIRAAVGESATVAKGRHG